MTQPNWLIGIATLFVVLTLVCGVLEGTYLGPGEIGLLKTLITWPGIWGIPTWIAAAWHMLWFDYACFYGDWLILKYAIFWPISVGLVVSYAALIFPQLISGLRSLIPGLR